ncbi:hypothetical protein BRC68_10300 [Halobacteriales archaeon QH_6_64_20]|nr:MAG: hypothetical protein BRC68_10300 [Halobacteriales archaeon QH_6_64_20]
MSADTSPTDETTPVPVSRAPSERRRAPSVGVHGGSTVLRTAPTTIEGTANRRGMAPGDRSVRSALGWFGSKR